MATDAKQWAEFERLNRQMLKRYGSGTLYEALGVKPDATTEDIGRKFKRKAHEYHPDLNRGRPDAEQRMKDLNSINDILSNPEKRESYDNWLRTAGIGASGSAAGAGGASSRANAPPSAEAPYQQHYPHKEAGRGSGSGSHNRRDDYVPGEKVHVPKPRGGSGFVFHFGFGEVRAGVYVRGSESLEHEVDLMYERVKRVSVGNSAGDIALGFSGDGKVHVRGALRGLEPEYHSGILFVNNLEGELLLPREYKGLEVDITQLAGDVRGKIAHKCRITNTAGDVSVELHAPLKVLVSNVAGSVKVNGMISEGGGRYTPPDMQPEGFLEVSCTAGDVKVAYMAGSQARR